MTFTYNLDTPDDVTRVRIHLGDTDAETALFSDAEINFAIDEESTWQAATLLLIENVLARFASEQDFAADWLRLDHRGNREYWEKLLATKRTRFGLARSTASVQHVTRVDSNQTTVPDYDD